jgi:hypothetical protein
MYSATAKRARVRVSVVHLVFHVANNDSGAALSQHTPVRPTLMRLLHGS